MRTIMVVGVAALAFVAGATVGWAPQDAPKTKPSPSVKAPAATTPGVPQEMSPEMKALMAFATPGSEQARLAKKVGVWDLTVKFYGAPGTPPSVTKNQSTYTMELGGRYLLEKMTGEAMGGPFQGTGITGYNNGTKRFESAWADTLSTSVAYSTGTVDANGEITWTGDAYNVAQGKMTKQRWVERMLPDGSMTAEMYDTSPDGKEVKAMEMVYTRVKK